MLLSKGYEVHGIIRRSSTFNTARIDHIFDKLKLHYGDLHSAENLAVLLLRIRPDEIYHLGAMSQVRVSFDLPVDTADTDGTGTIRVLEAIRQSGIDTRTYIACSSEMFGTSPPPQSESTPFRPCSPYAIAKVMAYHAGCMYRTAYGMFVANGILFNHESPRRGETFVTRKITRAVAKIKYGRQKDLVLGNIDALRDWGHAKDYVLAMWLMLQHSKADDFVIGTGQSYSVREFLDRAFKYVGYDYRNHVNFDKRYERPIEVPHLRADASKARSVLQWEPVSTIDSLVGEMVQRDLYLESKA